MNRRLLPVIFGVLLPAMADPAKAAITMEVRFPDCTLSTYSGIQFIAARAPGGDCPASPQKSSLMRIERIEAPDSESDPWLVHFYRTEDPRTTCIYAELESYWIRPNTGALSSRQVGDYTLDCIELEPIWIRSEKDKGLVFKHAVQVEEAQEWLLHYNLNMEDSDGLLTTHRKLPLHPLAELHVVVEIDNCPIIDKSIWVPSLATPKCYRLTKSQAGCLASRLTEKDAVLGIKVEQNPEFVRALARGQVQSGSIHQRLIVCNEERCDVKVRDCVEPTEEPASD